MIVNCCAYKEGKKVGDVAIDDISEVLDVLRAEGFARLKGRHIGLITNQTGRARDGNTTIDLLHEAKDLTQSLEVQEG